MAHIYTIYGELGEGSYSQVSLSIDKDKNKFAIKRYKKKNHTVYQSEINILKLLKGHQNILSYHDSYIHEGEMCIVFEYIDGHSLRDEIKLNMDLPLCRHAFSFYAKQMISGLQYIHKHNIAHLDIKPRNIMVSKSKVVKYVDFGLSCSIGNKNGIVSVTHLHKRGTTKYLPPENSTTKYSEKGIPFKQDIWGMGVIFKLFTRGTKDKKLSMFTNFICTEDYRDRPYIDEISEYFYDNVKA